jgi:hypothetical protein
MKQNRDSKKPGSVIILLYLICRSAAYGRNRHIWWWCNSCGQVPTTATPQSTGCSVKTVSRSTTRCHDSTMAATKDNWGTVWSWVWAQSWRRLRLLSMPRGWDNRAVMRRSCRRRAMVMRQGYRRAAVTRARWSRRKLRRNLWCY